MKRLSLGLLLSAAVAYAFPNPDGSCGITTEPLLTAARQGRPYSTQITVSECSTPFRLFELASGTLPPGLRLDPLTLSIVGTPTAAGTYAFSLRLLDAARSIPSQSFVLRVNRPLTIDTPALASGVAGAAYTDRIYVSGGSGAAFFNVVAGSLPAGLSLSETGIVSGTPASTGVTTFRIQAADSSESGETAEFPYTIAVRAAGEIAAASPSLGSVGVVYSLQLASTLSPSTFALALGALPPGLSLSPAGAITGTPTTPGAYHFAVRSTAGLESAWRSFRILVSGVGAVEGAPRSGEFGFAYDHVFQVTGGVAPYRFSITSGTLPDGLVLDPDTGAVYGEPEFPLSAAVAANSPLRVRAAAAVRAAPVNLTVAAVDQTGRSYAGNFSIDILDPIFSQSEGPSPDQGAVGQPYSDSPYPVGGGLEDGPKRYRVIGGTLPPGLVLNPETGVANGTPTTAGSETFVPEVLVTDDLGGSLLLGGGGSYEIAGDMSFGEDGLPGGRIDTAYSGIVSVQDAVYPVTFAITGALPPGIVFNSSAGTFTGSPTTAGSFPFSVMVTDRLGRTTTGSYSIVINSTVVITTTALPRALPGASYLFTLQASSPATAPASWTIAGLPPGINSDGPLIIGTPTTSGDFPITVTASFASFADTRTFVLHVFPAPEPVSAALPPASAGLPYSATVAATGGRGTLQFFGFGLPAGLAITTGGVITGTPLESGSFSPTIGVQDQDSESEASEYSLAVADAIQFRPDVLPNGTLGVSYETAVSVFGGGGANTVSLAGGSLPPGLSLTGVSIAGTPTTAGEYEFTLQATDAAGRNGSAAYRIVIAAPLTITSEERLDDATLLTAYSAPIAVTGGGSTRRFEIASGNLPPLLAIDPATGTISQTPLLLGGAYSFDVRVSDADGRTATRTHSMAVGSGFAITTLALPNATRGVAYTQSIVVANAIPAVVFSPGSGFPPGLALDPATGAITGAPTTAGTYTFQIAAVDGAQQTAARSYTILVADPLQFTTAPSLPNATIGTQYLQALATEGGRAPVTFQLTDGSLPPGLTLNPSGALAGDPTAVGAFQFTIRASDADNRTTSRSFSIGVAGSLQILTGSLGIAVPTEPFTLALRATGGSTPYTWATEPALPSGLVLDPSSGLISGAVTAPQGSYPLLVRVTDARRQVAARTLILTVTAPPAAPLTLTPNATPGGVVGQPYSVTFTAAGGEPGYSLGLVYGALPPGLSLNGFVLSGTPTSTGTFRFALRLADSKDRSLGVLFTVIVEQAPSPLVITPATLPPAEIHKGYVVNFTAEGGKQPYTFSLAGPLPPGMSTGGQGTFSGTPSQSGTYNLVLTVTDAAGTVATRNYVFEVAAQDRLQITNTPPADLQPLNQPFHFAFTTSGGQAPIVFSLVAGSLPAGIALDANGVLSGTATEGGTFEIFILATDALGNTAPASVTLRFGSSLAITTSALPQATAGQPYSASLAFSGGVAPVGAWTISLGSLPDGLTLSSEGVIAGTATAPGTSTFTVGLRDASSTTATRVLSITVALPELPAGQISGAPDTLPSAQQTNVGFSLTAPFPAEITGQLLMDFTPDAVNSSDDPAVQFSTGGRTAAFTIPAGQVNAQFPADPLRILTGTVAGAIRIRTETNPATGTPAEQTIRVARAVPVITAGMVQQGTGSLTVRVDGFSNTRELSSATFRFNPVAGANLQSSDVTVNVSSIFTTWYQSAASQAFGSQFRFAMPFTVNGPLTDIDSVAVTLTNTAGASQAFTVRLR